MDRIRLLSGHIVVTCSKDRGFLQVGITMRARYAKLSVFFDLVVFCSVA
jgi:hypothetical protein